MSVAFNSDVNLTVEIAFDSDPFATSQTFSDVSAYIREFSIDRGRQHDLADYQTGTASVVLNNSDDRFNPLNTSSPYYDATAGESKISPFRQVKISGAYDGTTTVLFCMSSSVILLVLFLVFNLFLSFDPLVGIGC